MTKKWYIKEFSKLTGISVRTLHHYDDIDLLNPFEKLANGYRRYSEQDLLKLQQIIALKSFGIRLSQIKQILDKNLDIETHLLGQMHLLKEKVSSLEGLIRVLQQTINSYRYGKSINWDKTLKLIRMYEMSEKLDNKWITKVLSGSDLQEYIKFESELKEKKLYTKDAFEEEWINICKKINNHINDDPRGNIGIDIGEQIHILVHGLYGHKYASLKMKIWNKGFMSGANQNYDNHGLSMEMIKWIDSAMGAYWQNRNRNILKKIDSKSDDLLIEEFKTSLNEMYGNDSQSKYNLFREIYSNEKIPEKSKYWIKKYSSLLV